MGRTALKTWEREFRAAAAADHYAGLRNHLVRLGLPEFPELLLEGTVKMVNASLAFLMMDNATDGRPERFLAMQKYNPAEASSASYVFTFDLHGKAYARLLIDRELQSIDLADLYEYPWNDYQVVGYGCIRISRPDWADLTGEEVEQVIEDVTRDLRFDYNEDELNVWFEECPDVPYLLVGVHDV